MAAARAVRAAWASFNTRAASAWVGGRVRLVAQQLADQPAGLGDARFGERRLGGLDLEKFIVRQGGGFGLRRGDPVDPCLRGGEAVDRGGEALAFRRVGGRWREAQGGDGRGHAAPRTRWPKLKRVSAGRTVAGTAPWAALS